MVVWYLIILPPLSPPTVCAAPLFLPTYCICTLLVSSTMHLLLPSLITNRTYTLPPSLNVCNTLFSQHLPYLLHLYLHLPCLKWSSSQHPLDLQTHFNQQQMCLQPLFPQQLSHLQPTSTPAIHASHNLTNMPSPCSSLTIASVYVPHLHAASPTLTNAA